MTTSFFKVASGQLNARLTESDSWSVLTTDAAGPFIGKAVMMRTRSGLGVDAEAALLIEKDPDHSQHTAYWDSINTLTTEANTELGQCLDSLAAV
jgi:hypothetical protein